MTTNREPFSTRLCELLGIRYPIMQAGMGLIARGPLAAAVSNAGGLGVIGAGQLTIDELRAEIATAKRLTRRPFGVDILFAQVPNATDATTVRYTKDIEAQIELVLAERVPVLVSGLGNPLGVIPDAHALGMVVLSVVGNVRQAKRVVESGVDAVIAQGHEAGGHTGRIGSVVLVPAIVDAVNVPVVAAGGFADGRGLVAALALGATGVWLGTRFIASAEATAHANYKNRITTVDEESTVVTLAHSGKPCRLLRNNFTAEWERRSDDILGYPRQFVDIGQPASVRARLEGDIDNGSAPAGQVAGIIRRIQPAAEIVESIMAEARATVANWGV